jgi:hypothetical protein
MKKRLLLSVGLLLITTAFAQNGTALKRNVTRAINENNSAVNITVDWQKPVRMRDLMSRPPRSGADGDMVIRYDTKTLSCKGMFTNTGCVVMPAVCVQNEDFMLTGITLFFSNGKKLMGGQNLLSIKEELAYIPVSADITRGLAGVVLAKIPAGKTLHETFGEKVSFFLINFFQTHGIRSHARRMGLAVPKPNLQIGDAVMLDGKLVALIKEVPRIYSVGFSGIAPEFPLAIIR